MGATEPVRPVSLARLCLALDGRVKAMFADNSVLLLNASGSAFVHCTNGGSAAEQSCQTQLSEYALSRFAAKLAVALEFRNMHVDVPYFCQTLKRYSKGPKEQQSNLGYKLTDIWWPASPTEAWSTGAAQVLPDGNISVSTTDASARMVLHSNRNRFAVCYPLLTGYNQADSQYQYAWQTQVFSLDLYPPRWAAAVQLLLDIAACQDQHTSPQPATSHTPSTAAALPQFPQPTLDNTQQLAFYPDPASQRTPPCTHLPDALNQPRSCVCDGFSPGSWWLEPCLDTLPSDVPLLMEWTPEATYQFNPDTRTAQAWLQDYASWITSDRQGRFITHVTARAARDPAQEKMYAAHSVPEFVWVCAPRGGFQDAHVQDSTSTAAASLGTSTATSRCPLAKFAAHALKLREHACRALEAQQRQHQEATGTNTTPTWGCTPNGGVMSHQDPHTAQRSIAPLQARDNQVVYSEEVSGEGSFTAYADGRVRGFFQDRTIMHLNQQHTHCKVILPDGKGLFVAVDNPVGVEAHMRVLLGFASWAFCSPEEQAAALQAHAVVQVHMAASQRMTQILDYTLTNQLPDSCKHTSYYPEPPCDPHHRCTAPAADPEYTPSCYAASNGATQWMASDGIGGGVGAGDMQAQIELLLQRNADLLKNL